MTEFAGQQKRRRDAEGTRGVKALRELLAHELEKSKAASDDPTAKVKTPVACTG